CPAIAQSRCCRPMCAGGMVSVIMLGLGFSEPTCQGTLLEAAPRAKRFTKEDNDNVRALLERAIELDPQFALPFALLALTYVTQDFNLTKAYELASRAVALDDQESACHRALGYVCLYLRLYDKALAHTEKAVF